MSTHGETRARGSPTTGRPTATTERRTSRCKHPATHRSVAILNKLGATGITNGGTVVPPFSAHTDWWGHHWRGGNRVGSAAATSTFNGWQQAWTAPNLFAAGEVNNTTGDTVPSGTHIAGPQVQIASEGMQKYLKSPGLLTGSI